MNYQEDNEMLEEPKTGL